MIADVGLGVGVAGLAASAILFLLSRPGPPSREASRAPRPWLGLGGPGIAGTFQ